MTHLLQCTTFSFQMPKNSKNLMNCFWILIVLKFNALWLQHFDTMTTFYTIVSRDAYAFLLQNDYLNFDEESDDLWETPMNKWMVKQMRKRLPQSAFSADDTENHPHYLYCDKNDINWAFLDVSQLVLLKLHLNKSNVLMFDDNGYYMVANNICNGGLSDPHLYLADDEADEQANVNASSENKIKSWEKMFDIKRTRDPTYYPAIDVRGMTPYIAGEMVVAAYMRPKFG